MKTIFSVKKELEAKVNELTAALVSAQTKVKELEATIADTPKTQQDDTVPKADFDKVINEKENQVNEIKSELETEKTKTQQFEKRVETKVMEELAKAGSTPIAIKQ